MVEEDEKPSGAERLPSHESAVRRMTSEAHGAPYRAFVTLAEAKASDDAVAVFEGDYGGQIYLVVRASYVQCSESTLQQLAADLDALRWRDPEGACVYFEQHPLGAVIPGGMGGGVVDPEVWVHKELRALEPAIRRVLQGERLRLKE